MRLLLLTIALCALAGCPAAHPVSDSMAAAPPSQVHGKPVVLRSQDSAAKPPKLATTTFAVEGMTCADCSSAINAEVIKLKGVTTVAADYKRGQAVVQYDPAKVTSAQIIAAINSLKYKASVKPAT